MDLVLKQLSQLVGAHQSNGHQLKVFLMRIMLVLIVMTIGSVLNIHWSITAFTLIVGLIQLERIFNKIQTAKSKLLKIELGKKVIADLYNKYDFIDKLKIENISRSKRKTSIELIVYTMVYNSDSQHEYLQKIKKRLIEKHNFSEVFIHLSTIN